MVHRTQSPPVQKTVETSHGAVGIVHAEFPHLSWDRATELLERRHEAGVALLQLPGSREAVRRYRRRPVEGLRALVHGHAPVRDVERTSNRWNIDTGAGIPSLNRLTVLEVNGAEFRSRTFDVDEISKTCRAAYGYSAFFRGQRCPPACRAGGGRGRRYAADPATVPRQRHRTDVGRTPGGGDDGDRW